MTKFEAIVAREIHLTDNKLPLMFSIDNRYSNHAVKSIIIKVNMLVAMTKGKSNERIYFSRKTVMYFDEEIRVEKNELKTDIMVNLSLMEKNTVQNNKETQLVLKHPMVYSKNIICEYELHCELVYESGCCRCINNGPELNIILPIIEVKQEHPESKDKRISDPKAIQINVNAANVTDPHLLMKSRFSA